MTNPNSDFTVNIVAINLEKRLVRDKSGETYPMEKLFDKDGDQTDDADQAFSALCGYEGRWFTVVLAEFTTKQDS